MALSCLFPTPLHPTVKCKQLSYSVMGRGACSLQGYGLVCRVHRADGWEDVLDPQTRAGEQLGVLKRNECPEYS